MQVIVAPHSPAWRGAFLDESRRIESVLGDGMVALHHIGSTAIPGIVAKPVVDMLLEAADLARIDADADGLKQLGYEVMGEFGIPGRRYFRKDDAHGVRTHQLHAFASGDANVERHLAFRDYLIAHTEAAHAYGHLKARLAEAHAESMDAYIAGKDGFIKTHEAIAIAWRQAQAREG